MPRLHRRYLMHAYDTHDTLRRVHVEFADTDAGHDLRTRRSSKELTGRAGDSYRNVGSRHILRRTPIDEHGDVHELARRVAHLHDTPRDTKVVVGETLLRRGCTQSRPARLELVPDTALDL